MDQDNIIINNHFLREEFNDIFIKVALPPYSDNTIHKSFSKLTKLSLLIPCKGKRGAYQVNPVYFIRGDEMNIKNSSRDALVRDNLEKNNQLPILKNTSLNK